MPKGLTTWVRRSCRARDGNILLAQSRHTSHLLNKIRKLNLKVMILCDDIKDEDTECLFCTGLFSHDKNGEKIGSMCEVLSLGA
jgi:hypothetical protein